MFLLSTMPKVIKHAAESGLSHVTTESKEPIATTTPLEFATSTIAAPKSKGKPRRADAAYRKRKPGKRAPPVVMADEKMQEEWLEVVHIAAKGCLGVRAKRDIEPNFRIVCRGPRMAKEDVGAYAAKHMGEPHVMAHFFLCADGSAIDMSADPKYGSRINEPTRVPEDESKSERSNCVLRQHRAADGAWFPVIVTVQKIAAGIELLYNYGWGAGRRITYKSAPAARLPKWLSSIR